MKNIIVPVDFSAVSENAAAYAFGMADFYGADLWLYHSYLLPAVLPDNGYPLVSPAELQNLAEYEMGELIRRISGGTTHKVNIGFEVELAYLHDGLPAFCEEKGADLVVMGLTGKNALTRLVAGSNTIKAIHELRYPVMVVPKDASFKMIMRIGFACDYVKVNETTPVALLRKMVEEFNAQLHVINIDWHNRHFRPEVAGEQVALHMHLHDLDVKYHSIESEDVTAGLNRFAEEQEIDLLIAIPKKHNLVEKLFSSSKTKELLYHAHLPVLCMHE